MSELAELVEDSESLFKKVSTGLKPILGDDSSLYDNDGVYTTISLIEQCAERVEREHLMSKNEQLEDILTPTIKVCRVVDDIKPVPLFLTCSRSTLPAVRSFCSSTTTWASAIRVCTAWRTG
jgi:hypothetical protein